MGKSIMSMADDIMRGMPPTVEATDEPSPAYVVEAEPLVEITDAQREVFLKESTTGKERLKVAKSDVAAGKKPSPGGASRLRKHYNKKPGSLAKDADNVGADKLGSDVYGDVPPAESQKKKNEATDDSGRLIPGTAAAPKKITIGKFRSQPGAGPGQAKRNALAKKEAEAKAKTADGDTNEARGIGGKWDTPSQKYSADRKQNFTPPTPEQVKKERDRRLKAGLNADGSKKTTGDEKNESLTGHEISVLKEAHKIMQRVLNERKGVTEELDYDKIISGIDTSTPAGAGRAKELRIKQKARRLDAKDKAKGQIQGYKVDDKGRPAKGGAVKPASAAAAGQAAKAHGDKNEVKEMTAVGSIGVNMSGSANKEYDVDAKPMGKDNVPVAATDKSLRKVAKARLSKKKGKVKKEAFETFLDSVLGEAQKGRIQDAEKDSCPPVKEGSGGVKKLQRKLDAQDGDEAVATAGRLGRKKAQGENRPLLRRVGALNK